MRKQEEAQISQQLANFASNKPLNQYSEAYVSFRQLIIKRREMRFNQIEGAIYIMRMIMLVSSLRLIGHTYLDPIFVSFCGIMQAGCTVFKAMKGKKNYYKLNVEDLEEQKKQKQQQQMQSQQQAVNKPTKTEGMVMISEHSIETNNKARSRALSDIAYDKILKIHKDKELQQMKLSIKTEIKTVLQERQ